MDATSSYPSFERKFRELDQFIHGLVDLYNAGRIKSWDDLRNLVDTFFSSQTMAEMEALLPGWGKMADFGEGITLTHVMCVFLGLYMMPEFLYLSPAQQGLMKWIVLLHDLEKEVREGKRDHAHAFRSAATAAKLLPRYGFTTSTEYDSRIERWAELTRTATTQLNDELGHVQDNRKIPEILDGIRRMFGYNTAAALITRTILFHLSVNMKEWPPANPLTEQEVKNYFDQDLLPLLRVMHLGDTDGWGLFDPPIRHRMRKDTNEIFDGLDRIIPR